MTDMKTEERLKTLWNGILPDKGTEERMRARVTAEAEKQADSGDGGAGENMASPGRTLRRMRQMAVACVLLAFGMSAVMLLREARAPAVYTYTMDTGETLVFPPAEAVPSMAVHLDYPVVVRPLTAEEAEGLFGRVSAVRGDYPLANDDLVWRGGKNGGDPTDMPASSGGIANDDLVWRQRVPGSETLIGDLPGTPDAQYVYTGTGDGRTASEDPEPAKTPSDGKTAGSGTLSAVYGTFREDTGELIRVEGELAGTKIAAAAPGIAVSDTVIGAGEPGRIDGCDVTLASFTTPPNSRGERTVVLRASFSKTVSVETTEGERTAEWNVTAEQAGPAEDAETAVGALLSAVRGILSHDARIVTAGE